MKSTFSADEICAIAKNQHNMLIALLINFLSAIILFLKILPQPIIGIVSLAVAIYIAVFLVKLRNAMKKNIVITIISVILLIVPVLSLLILLVNNQRATGILKDAGLKVGLMGVSEADLKKFLDASSITE